MGKFCTNVLGRPEIATDPLFATQPPGGRTAMRLTGIDRRFLQRHDLGRGRRAAGTPGIANGRLNDPLAAWNHEQFAARDKWREVMTENGPVRAMSPPFEFTDFEAVMGDVPAVGQHTDQVLAELGYGPADIASLRHSGAV